MDTLVAALWWLLGTIALGLAVWFWVDVANAMTDKLKNEPRQTTAAILKSLCGIATLVLLLWLATNGGRG